MSLERSNKQVWIALEITLESGNRDSIGYSLEVASPDVDVRYSHTTRDVANERRELTL